MGLEVSSRAFFRAGVIARAIAAGQSSGTTGLSVQNAPQSEAEHAAKSRSHRRVLGRRRVILHNLSGPRN